MILSLEEGAGAVVPFSRKGGTCRPLRPTQAADDRERQGVDAPPPPGRMESPSQRCNMRLNGGSRRTRESSDTSARIHHSERPPSRSVMTITSLTRDCGRPHTIAASNSRPGAAQELLYNDILNVGKGHLRTSPAKRA